MSKVTSVLIVFALCAGLASAQDAYYDRKDIPGHYTLGLYADADGRSSEIVLEPGQDHFEAWIGITGDSTRTFSALVCRVELPRGIAIDGPAMWKPIHGLVQWGTPTGEGLQIEFNKECLNYDGIKPAMAGRLKFKVDRKDFEQGTIQLAGHRKWGISIELCDPDRGWPKPYCDAIDLTVSRKKTFWQKLRGLFG